MPKKYPPENLEEIPNIGKSIANDLRGVGIENPSQLGEQEPLALYLALSATMGKRHDPCVLYTLLSAQHFLKTGEARAWAEFTEYGKRLLKEQV